MRHHTSRLAALTTSRTLKGQSLRMITGGTGSTGNGSSDNSGDNANSEGNQTGTHLPPPDIDQ